MRFHQLAVSVVVGASASMTPFSSFSAVAEAFVVPQSLSQNTLRTKTIIITTTTSRFVVGSGGDSSYVSLEDDTSKTKTSSTATKRKPKQKVDKIRDKLKTDLAAAEESKARVAQQLSEAEEVRASLAVQEAKAASDAGALDAKLKAFELKQATNTASFIGSGSGVGGAVVEIAGPLVGGFLTLTGLAAARSSLTERNQKVEEERLRREEEERKAEEAVKNKARQLNQNQNLLALLGTSAAGLGAFGTFFGGDIGGGGGGTIVDSMSKNALRDSLSKQQTEISQQQSPGTLSSVTTSASDKNPTVEMPYLEKEIVKAETKSNKRILSSQKSKRTLVREAAEEQKAIEARLETRLAEAPARKAAEVAAAAEAKIEGERKASLEKQEAERIAAEEKLAAERKALKEKQRIAAEETAKAERKALDEKQRVAAEETAKAERKVLEQKQRIAAEETAKAERKALDEKQRVAAEETAKAERKVLEQKQRIAAEETAKAEKIVAERDRIKAIEFKAIELAKEKENSRIKLEKEAQEKEEARIKVDKEAKIKAEKFAAEKRAVEEKAKEEAAVIELLKQQNVKSNGFLPKVPAVSEMMFGDKKPSQVTDKGLSNVFNGNKVVVGGVALAGLAVAAAVIAANESPSVSSTFKVTGKTPKEFLDSSDTEPTSRGTVRIRQPGEEENEKKKQVIEKALKTESSSPSQNKNALRDELSRQRANINQQAAEKFSTTSDAKSIQNPSSDFINSSTKSSTRKSFLPFGSLKPRAASNDPLSASMTTLVPEKKTFSPFGGKPPVSATIDCLSSNTASQNLIDSDKKNPELSSAATSKPSILEPDTSSPELSSNRSYMNTIGAGSSSVATNKSFSPFGSSKPVAAQSDSLYSAPVPHVPEAQLPIQATESTTMSSDGLNLNNIGEGVGPITSTQRNLFSPFQGSKPVAATSDSLYSAPSIQNVENVSISEIEPTTRVPDSSSFTSNFSSSPAKNYSPFGGAKPVAAGNDSLYSPPGEIDKFSTISLTARDLDGALAISPETDAFQTPIGNTPFTTASSSTGGVKKSFSPFGSKPGTVTSNANNGGGGYLDGL